MTNLAAKQCKFKCIYENGSHKWCTAPVACDSFGYCRERNFDGKGMSTEQVERRKAESEATNKIERDHHGRPYRD
jgi:hypothetical protein